MGEVWLFLFVIFALQIGLGVLHNVNILLKSTFVELYKRWEESVGEKCKTWYHIISSSP